MLIRSRPMFQIYKNHVTDLPWKPFDWFPCDGNINLRWVEHFHEVTVSIKIKNCSDKIT